VNLSYYFNHDFKKFSVTEIIVTLISYKFLSHTAECTYLFTTNLTNWPFHRHVKIHCFVET